jgi:hypothetical protein
MWGKWCQVPFLGLPLLLVVEVSANLSIILPGEMGSEILRKKNN